MFQLTSVYTASGTHTYALVGELPGKEIVGPTGPLGP